MFLWFQALPTGSVIILNSSVEVILYTSLYRTESIRFNVSTWFIFGADCKQTSMVLLLLSPIFEASSMVFLVSFILVARFIETICLLSLEAH